MTESAARRANLPLLESDRPTLVNLVLTNNDSPPILLRLATSADLADPISKLKFDRVPFKLGSIMGQYDMILGAPFLSSFSLSVSLSNKNLRCDSIGRVISDYRFLTTEKEIKHEIKTTDKASEKKDYPCEEAEKEFLREFHDLFPNDIPAVSDEAEEQGLFADGSFPEKLQDVNSKIRHKIILKDPDVVFNERQYPYPQIYLTAWRTLYVQHLAAGRIQRSTSHYQRCNRSDPRIGIYRGSDRNVPQYRVSGSDRFSDPIPIYQMIGISWGDPI
jgi:hypothetical protein